MQELFTTDALVGLLTLTALEIVLGVDNVIFISILAAKLPKEQQARARSGRKRNREPCEQQCCRVRAPSREHEQQEERECGARGPKAGQR